MLLNQQPKAEAFFDTWLLETCKYNELEHLQPLEPPRTIAGPKIARPGGQNASPGATASTFLQPGVPPGQSPWVPPGQSPRKRTRGGIGLIVASAGAPNSPPARWVWPGFAGGILRSWGRLGGTAGPFFALFASPAEKKGSSGGGWRCSKYTVAYLTDEHWKLF